MAGDPGIDAFVARLTALEEAAPPATSDDDRRLQYLARCRALDPATDAVPWEDRDVPGPGGAIRVRLFRPAGARELPAILFLHGGGWVLGDLDSHHAITADLAAGAVAAVVAVDYRRAPEHPFPAAFDDACAALAHLAASGAALGIDPARLAVAGDSAGGNLAAAVALAARDRGGPALRAQALAYPCLDPALQLPSCRANAEGPLLTTAGMRAYWQAYLGGAATTDDPYAAPLRARDLGGLPPALVSVAGRDPLCDEGRHYAERLRAAGGEVTLREAPRLVHGHLRARHLSADAAREFQAMCAWLRERLG